MRESRTSGSVRGVPGNRHSYRDRVIEPRNIRLSWSGMDNPSTRRGEKADALNVAEGSSSFHAMASGKNTTGVGEQGMHSQG